MKSNLAVFVWAMTLNYILKSSVAKPVPSPYNVLDHPTDDDPANMHLKLHRMVESEGRVLHIVHPDGSVRSVPLMSTSHVDAGVHPAPLHPYGAQHAWTDYPGSAPPTAHSAMQATSTGPSLTSPADHTGQTCAGHNASSLYPAHDCGAEPASLNATHATASTVPGPAGLSPSPLGNATHPADMTSDPTKTAGSTTSPASPDHAASTGGPTSATNSTSPDTAGPGAGGNSSTSTAPGKQPNGSSTSQPAMMTSFVALVVAAFGASVLL